MTFDFVFIFRFQGYHISSHRTFGQWVSSVSRRLRIAAVPSVIWRGSLVTSGLHNVWGYYKIMIINNNNELNNFIYVQSGPSYFPIFFSQLYEKVRNIVWWLFILYICAVASQDYDELCLRQRRKIVVQKWYFYSSFKTKFIIDKSVSLKARKANFLSLKFTLL